MQNRWLIAFSCAWINLFIFAAFRSAGVLYLSIVDTFQCTFQQAAWSVSLSGSVASITGLAAGFCAHYVQIRLLVIMGVLCCGLSLIVTYFAQSIQFVTITIGLVQGIGIGFVTNLLPAILNAHFVEKKAIALGISYAGATLGAFIFPVLIQTLLVKFQFHNTILILGGVTLSGVVGGIFLTKPKEVKEPNEENEVKTAIQMHQLNSNPLIDECNTIVYVDNNQLYANITQPNGSNPTEPESRQLMNGNNGKKTISLWSKIIKNLRNDSLILLDHHFMICTVTYISFILDFVAFIIILPDVAKAQGIADVDSKWLLSIFSITDFIGRIVPGWFSYWELVTDKTIYILSITAMGLCMALLITVNTWIQFVLISLLCGLATGCQMVLSPAILADYLGNENTAVAFGLANFICGLFTLVTRPMIIGVKDIYGNYDLLGYVLSGVALFSGILWVFDILFTSISKRRQTSRATTFN